MEHGGHSMEVIPWNPYGSRPMEGTWKSPACYVCANVLRTIRSLAHYHHHHHRPLPPPAIPTNRLSTICTRVRHKAQQERQAVLRKRRKECQRKLRLQDAEAEAARAAMVQARDAWYTAARKTRKMQAAADKKARGRESGRFVKAAGAVKAWRARKFEPAELLAAGSNWTLRFAKSITNRINRVDDEELGGERSDVGGATTCILYFVNSFVHVIF